MLRNRLAPTRRASAERGLRARRRRRPGDTAFLVALLLFLPREGRTARIDPAVANELAGLTAGAQTTVLLVLKEQADIGALDRALTLRHATRRERHREVIESLRNTAARTQPAVLEDLALRRTRGEVSGFAAYWISNVTAVRGTRPAIEGLATRPDIEAVVPVPRAVPPEPVDAGPPPSAREGLPSGLYAIRAPEVWRELGINGSGAIVAIFDDGVDGAHPALSGNWRGNHGFPPSECWFDQSGTCPDRPCYGSHGTGVMGVVAGMDPATGDTIGVAWGALWIAANQACASDLYSCLLAGFQWFADPDGDPETVDEVPDVVNNSWSLNDGPCDDFFWRVIDNCEAAGMVVIFSAGNRGPNPSTVHSPQDRATSIYQNFCVGAVDANLSWPYPLCQWSSRGPSLCPDVPEANRFKPELVAPGNWVYTAESGGGYGHETGTSLSAPHVAGVVGLMRAANPDLDVVTIKRYLLESARDEGPAGDDNGYGRGMLDAYQAVLFCLADHGTLAGRVANASNGGSAIAGARVTLVEPELWFTSGDDGRYSGLAPVGTYTVEVTHPSFTSAIESGVEITVDRTTTLDFSLTDIGAPQISEVDYPPWVRAQTPIPVSAAIFDYSATTADIVYRVNHGDWIEQPMFPGGTHRFYGSIPAQPLARVEFYLRAVDAASNTAVSPPGAPAEVYRAWVVDPVFADDAESDLGWTMEQADTTDGAWVRMDPWGTTWLSQPMEPADDHTPDPGTRCFVTGEGFEGGGAQYSDVDRGCVTLTSPVIDLSRADMAIVSYWRWFGQSGWTGDDAFTAQASNDGGATWTALETLNEQENSWRQSTTEIGTLLPLTGSMRFRFVVCDVGHESVVEGAVDDFVVGAAQGISAVETAGSPSRPELLPNRPNPFAEGTSLRFTLDHEGPVELLVFDMAGRLVRRLEAGRLPAGEHAVVWDGRDQAGRPAGSGVFVYELRSGELRPARKMIRLR